MYSISQVLSKIEMKFHVEAIIAVEFIDFRAKLAIKKIVVFSSILNVYWNTIFVTWQNKA